MNLREELVQVAAVCVSIIEDMDYEMADSHWSSDGLMLNTDVVLAEVFDERRRQDEKWGPQHHDWVSWLLILMEEVGEAAEHELGANEIVTRMSTLGLQAKAWLEENDLA